jgi:hypothetical protein
MPDAGNATRRGRWEREALTRAVPLSADEIQVPIQQHSLTHDREIAEYSRERVITQISKI